MHGPGDTHLFTRVARLYDLVMPPARRGNLDAGLALADREVERLVDVGGGTGRATVAVEADERVVLDAARGMLRRARARDAALDPVLGDATRPPIRPGSVDAAITVDALHHMPDPAAVLRATADCLAPGGVFVVRDFDPETLLGRGLVAAEHAIGMGSTFLGPDEVAAGMASAGLAPTVLDRGFGYTVAGVRDDD